MVYWSWAKVRILGAHSIIPLTRTIRASRTSLIATTAQICSVLSSASISSVPVKAIIMSRRSSTFLGTLLPTLTSTTLPIPWNGLCMPFCRPKSRQLSCSSRASRRARSSTARRPERGSHIPSPVSSTLLVILARRMLMTMEAFLRQWPALPRVVVSLFDCLMLLVIVTRHIDLYVNTQHVRATRRCRGPLHAPQGSGC